MKHRSIRAAALLLFAGLLLTVQSRTSLAQTFEQSTDIQADGTSYHVFARSGEPTIQVFVFGTVGATGIFQIGIDTDLGQLLAMTGGVSTGPKVAGERHQVTIRLLRRQGGERTAVYEEPLERMLRNPGAHPDLQDGDVLEVNTEIRTRKNWLETVSTLASFTTFAIAIDTILRR